MLKFFIELVKEEKMQSSLRSFYCLDLFNDITRLDEVEMDFIMSHSM